MEIRRRRLSRFSFDEASPTKSIYNFSKLSRSIEITHQPIETNFL